MTKEMDMFGDTKKIDNYADVIKQIDNLDKNSPVFGIDLGTTNSAIAVIPTGDDPKIITLTNGRDTMPSCVMWKDGKFIVGLEAYKHREQANVIYSVKRYMQDPNKTVVFRDGSKTLEMTPAQVSAEILKGLVEQTGGLYGTIKDVVVTVPAYFDQNGRNATREACQLAGLNLIDIINEPTAAALCYDIKESDVDSSDFITFDFGGGTLDVTLARITGNDTDNDTLDIYGIESDDEKKDSGKIIQCIAIEGNSHLGGDDIDLELLKIVDKRLQKEANVSIYDFSREYREGLILRLERFKKSGTTQMYGLVIDTITNNGTPIKHELHLSMEDFNQSLDPVYRECKKVLDALLRNNVNQVSTVLLVGGSTKNPLLVARLEHDYPSFKFTNAVNQDLAVALGAAIKGKIDKFGSDTIQIFDILPISIGINDNGIFTPLIPAGTVLPAAASMPFVNVGDNQTIMDLEVLQGKSKLPEECVSLGVLTFDNLPKAKAGELSLIATITVNANSVLTCTGTVNGEKQVLTLNLTGGTTNISNISKNEKLVNRWKKTAEKLNAEDRELLMSKIALYPEQVSRKEINDLIGKLTAKLEDI